MPREPSAAERLAPIFEPRSVAVVGASRSREKLGGVLLHNVITYGFQGTIYPVNPKADSVHSVKAYPSVAAVPDRVDLAVLVVPAAQVPQVVAQCGRKGVKGLVVITAGFRETGAAGEALERQVHALVRKHRMVMVGPNCMGVINTDPAVRLNATFAPVPPQRGNVSFLSQSGALGVAILEHARAINVGLSKFVSLGNETDAAGMDFVEAFEADANTKLILAYMESFKNPRRFFAVARRVARRKPILALKSGRTETGARAALSHTGRLAGSDVATNALFDQTGILRMASIEELFDVAMAFSALDPPKGPRIAIITNAGGPGVMAADALISEGLELAKLRPATKRRLEAAVPEEASVENPVDMIADADAARYAKVMDITLSDPNVDASVVICVPPVLTDELSIARAIWQSAQRKGKPVVTCFLARGERSPGYVEMVSHGIPSYLFPESAAGAMASLVRHAEFLRREEGTFRRFRVNRARVRRVLQAARRTHRTRLTETEVIDVLDAYGIPSVRTRAARTVEDALRAAEGIGYPVALKGVSRKMVHKTEFGAVVLDIRNAEELWARLRELKDRLRRERIPLEGFLVQEYVSGGKETILGLSVDEKFGPLLTFGLGGIYVEVLRDLSFGLAPLTDVDARRMVEGVRSYPLLAGVRGEKPADVDALVDALQRLSQLVTDFEELREMDVNPFVVFEKGKGAKVVDARVVLTL